MSTDPAFPSTHWSNVEQVGRGRNDSLEKLLRRYMPALKSYLVSAKRLRTDEAEDLLQEFIAEKVVQQQLIRHADRYRGRFRTFLLSVLNNFVASEWRKRNAKRRRPAKPPVSMSSLVEPVADESATEDVFVVAWGRQVIAETVTRMRQACADSDRARMWEIFSERILDPVFEGRAPTPYRELVDRYGLESPSQASNLLLTAKRLFARTLREVVGEYAKDSDETEEELVELRRIISNSGAYSADALRI